MQLTAIRVPVLVAIATGAIVLAGSAFVPVPVHSVHAPPPVVAVLLPEPSRCQLTATPVATSREGTLLDALATVRSLGTSDDVAMTFLEANMLRRSGNFDDALTLFLDILDHHMDHETAEYAADLALDCYQSLGRRAERTALARRLLKNRHFLRGKSELAAKAARAAYVRSEQD